MEKALAKQSGTKVEVRILHLQILQKEIKALQKSIGSEKAEKNDFSWNESPTEQNLKT